MNLLDYLCQKESVSSVITSDRIKIGGTTDAWNMMLMACDFYQGNASVFVVLPNLYLAQNYYDELIAFMPEEDVLFFPSDELVSAEMIAATGDFLFERIQTLYTLLEGRKKMVVTNLHGAIKYELPLSCWQNNIFKLKQNDSVSIAELLKRLVRLGYEAVYTITKTGEFAHRGSIVDIFPLGQSDPIRLDFFGDEIDTIKTFNMETQRSKDSMSEITILPVTEFMYDEADFKSAKEKILRFTDQFSLSPIEEEMLAKDLFSLENHQNLTSLSRYLMFFSPKNNLLFDFVKEKRIYWVDPVKSKEAYDHLLLDLNEYCGRIGGYMLAHMNLFSAFEFALQQANVQIEGLRSLGGLDRKFYVRQAPFYRANPQAVLDDFKRYKDNKIVLLAYSNEERFKNLKDLALDQGLFLIALEDLSQVRYGQINGVYQHVPSFDLPDEDLLLLNDANLYETNAQPRKARYKSIYKNAIKISKYDELEIGDYVVHYDHGIGKYLGIKTIENNGIKRDFLYMMYAKGSALYIPLEQISSIMKYASKDVEGVLLHEIGSTAWAKTKARVRKRVHDISEKLIALYAARQNAKGFEFEEDTPEQAQFEADFEYELTPDQKTAIEAVKKDMESARPMDRLICGDVGYGKTEVAMRAAFKAVYGGKQVCVLAPTTILSQQHYETFRKRMTDYGIRVELLNRFIPLAKQHKIINDVATGGVDVLIGTHRVLSSEIRYKDLGLLIVDEEQRFGVTHKEKIKELKVNVDCITLSATPIPRTLQMSVMGLKDLSMIETPPKNRYPIQTYVLERNDRIITDAIEREMARKGQVFYLYNRVETIEQMADHLHTLVPEARICVGHGKLNKDQLENRIRDFIEKKYDILLCTTIIETGIDMPDTNTLIIHSADQLGLSQLYQIRGRVGRSNKIAYAYLMYEPRKLLTKEAEKRLETIKEFNELGSGFKIAMRDLSIRGSGDLLGEEQSGFVESVGLDMYLKILDEEIHHLTEEKEKQDPTLALPLFDRTIAKDYIENEDVRIEIHKKIDRLNSLAALKELKEELTDRFGQLPADLNGYLYEKLLKNNCKTVGIYKMDQSDSTCFDFVFSKDSSNKWDGNVLFQALHGFSRLKLSYKNSEIHLLAAIQNDKVACFQEICFYFDRILAKRP